MKSIAIVATLVSMSFVGTAMADTCRSTTIRASDHKYREDFGFCFAAMTGERYICNYDAETEETNCATPSEGPDFTLEWHGSRGFFVDMNGQRVAKLFDNGGGDLRILWQGGDVDTCTVSGHTVLWCE